MKNFREDIERSLQTARTFSVQIGSRTLTLREQRGKYQIQIKNGDKRPSVNVYRSRAIALDRFEEQIAYFRRSL